jgi:hypothetical protein
VIGAAIEVHKDKGPLSAGIDLCMVTVELALPSILKMQDKVTVRYKALSTPG